MIVVPKSVCPSCTVPYEYPGPMPIPPIESCPPCEPEEEAVIIETIPVSVCPCPSPPDPIVIPTKKKIKVTKVKLCYKEFVLAVSTTKFCDIGPKCHSGV
jgi:hypothetical protein